jgi:hypothetical protein
MALKRELLLIILLILVIAVLVKLIEFFQVTIVEADASKFVLEDLHTKYPTADVAIMSITPKTNDYGARYFEVKARVTQYANTSCPARSHIFYNYPAQNFVPQPAEIIASNCAVCTEGICNIAFPEEAIIASHTFSGTGAVQAYLNANPNTMPVVSEGNNIWIVTWNSDKAPTYYMVTVHNNGSIMNVSLRLKS